MGKLYMMVTEDELQLPLAVADTISELSRMIGINQNNVRSAICHRKHYKKIGKEKNNKYPKYVEVIIDD